MITSSNNDQPYPVTQDQMRRSLIFNRAFMSFGSEAEPFERADDVGYAITEFMWFKGRPFYPIGALAVAQVADVRLRRGEFYPLDDDNVDLIFRMRDADGGSFFEIVLRSDEGTRYGGWLWGRDIKVLDEFVDEHRVIVASTEHCEVRFEYRRDVGGYRSSGPLPVEKTVFVMERDARAGGPKGLEALEHVAPGWEPEQEKEM